MVDDCGSRSRMVALAGPLQSVPGLDAVGNACRDASNDLLTSALAQPEHGKNVNAKRKEPVNDLPTLRKHTSCTLCRSVTTLYIPRC